MGAKQSVGQDVFRQIFRDHWAEFKEAHPWYDTPYYDEVMEKMLGCGMEEGGFSEWRCGNCGGDVRRIAFSCKGSFCLSCSKVYMDNFVCQVSKSLRDGLVYVHVTLTVPKQVRHYFYWDRHEGELLAVFMRCGYACLEEAVSVAVEQKVKIGVIIVVQTYGRSGQYNPHLHVIMTCGGINESTGKWVELKFFPYEMLRKKWQYHLLKMLKEQVPTHEMKELSDALYKKYENGFVTHVTKGKVPNQFRGLAKYLAKYVVSPPIAVRRIVSYDGRNVRYWYNDHATKARKDETVDVLTFIGRMVQHILPKWFQRVRYFGLQATSSFKKWAAVIKEGLRRIGRVVKGAYQVISPKKYRERYKEGSGHDPMMCRYCGCKMDLWTIWHPKYGVIYDEFENIKSGKYEATRIPSRGDGCTIRASAHGVQLSMFPLWDRGLGQRGHYRPGDRTSPGFAEVHGRVDANSRVPRL